MAWTDHRLDDLAHRVDAGFEQAREDHVALERKFDARFEAMDAKFDGLRVELKGDIGKVDERINDLQKMMVQLSVTIVLGLLGLIGVNITA